MDYVGVVHKSQEDGESLLDKFEGSVYLIKQRKPNLSDLEVRECAAEKYLRAEFGPPAYKYEDWHDDKLKLQLLTMSWVNRLAKDKDRTDIDQFELAEEQLKLAVERVATGKNLISDFSERSKRFGEGPAKLLASQPKALDAVSDVLLTNKQSHRDLSTSDKVAIEMTVLSAGDYIPSSEPKPLPPVRGEP